MNETRFDVIPVNNFMKRRFSLRNMKIKVEKSVFQNYYLAKSNGKTCFLLINRYLKISIYVYSNGLNTTPDNEGQVKGRMPVDYTIPVRSW